MFGSNAFVYIIESPGSSEFLNNQLEGRTLSATLDIAGVPYEYAIAVNRTAFESCLGQRLLDAALRYRRLPVLHLSMHGNTDGIQLTSEESVSWHELAQMIEQWTDAMKGGLIVCMSSCSGANGCKMAMTTKPSQPFGLLIGSMTSVGWADAAIAYATFYHRLFKGASFNEAVEAMKQASGHNDFALFFGPALKAGWADWVSMNLNAVLQALGETETTSE